MDMHDDDRTAERTSAAPAVRRIAGRVVRAVTTRVVASLVVLSGCLASSIGAAAPVQLSPLTMRIERAPVPVLGADGRMHLVYELTVANLTDARVTIDRLDVRDRRGGAAVQTWTAGDLGRRLVVRDAAATPGVLGPSQIGIVYVHVTMAADATMPAEVEHALAVTIGPQSLVETAGRVRVAAATDSPPGGMPPGMTVDRADGTTSSWTSARDATRCTRISSRVRCA